MSKPVKYITYIRVSTAKQGKSGLGLEAQKRDIQLYLEHYSGKPYEVIAEYVEIESGGNDERAELNEAIQRAKKEKATLLVAKLDRLSRKVSFIAQLMEDKKLSFKLATAPNADKMQLYFYAIVAEQEREFISLRTKAALKSAKERGVKLGGLRDKTSKRNEAKKQKADEFARKMQEIIKPLIDAGKNYSQIANILNSQGIKTATNSTFYAQTVKNLALRVV